MCAHKSCQTEVIWLQGLFPSCLFSLNNLQTSDCLTLLKPEILKARYLTAFNREEVMWLSFYLTGRTLKLHLDPHSSLLTTSFIYLYFSHQYLYILWFCSDLLLRPVETSFYGSFRVISCLSGVLLVQVCVCWKPTNMYIKNKTILIYSCTRF